MFALSRGLTQGGQSRKFEAILCSLRPDYLGFYKNLLFRANTVQSRGARPLDCREDRHQLPGDARDVQKMLSAYTPLPPRPAPGFGAAMSGMAPYQDPTNSDCFDYNVIRESPRGKFQCIAVDTTRMTLRQ